LRIGSRKNATLICNFFHDNSATKEDIVPSGWKYIGAGITRSAYLGPDGFVYKVAHAWDYWNINEARAMRNFRTDPFLASIDVTTPRATLWTVEGGKVLALDYIDKAGEVECDYNYLDREKAPCSCGASPCYGELMQTLYEYGIADMFPENIHLAADGKYYLIDLGAQ
jgi:hypothetical protein